MKLGCIRWLLAFVVVATSNFSRAESSCDSVSFATMKVHYFLVASHALYGGDVLPAAFESDHRLLRNQWVQLLSAQQSDTEPTLLPMNRQPQVFFNQVYYNPLKPLAQSASRLCEVIQTTLPDGDNNDHYIFVTSLTGGQVVQTALEGCAKQLLPSNANQFYSYESATGETIRFNSRVRSYIVTPDMNHGFRPASDTVYPFYEFEFLKNLQAGSSFYARTANLALSGAPLLVLNHEIDAPSVRAFYPDMPMRSYPWAVDRNGELPSDSFDFRLDLMKWMSLSTLKLCAKSYCEANPDDILCKCQVVDHGAWGTEGGANDVSIYLSQHPECSPGWINASRPFPALESPYLSQFYPNLRSEFRQRGFGEELPKPFWKLPLKAPRCGDGRVDKGEECDDGNKLDGDGCDKNCRKEPPKAKCPNNRIEGEEECDSTDPAKPGGSCMMKLLLEGNMFLNAVRCNNSCKCELFTSPGGGL